MLARENDVVAWRQAYPKGRRAGRHRPARAIIQPMSPVGYAGVCRAMTDFARWFATHESQLRTLLREVYGIDAEVRLLAGEFDFNCLVAVNGAPAFLLKIMRAGCEPQLVDLQCRLLERLQASVPDVPLQRLIRTRAGAEVTELVDEAGERRILWLLTYLPGRVMAEVEPHTPALLGEIGATLARIDRALDGFDHPAARRAIKWDPRRSGWVRDHLHLVAAGSRRDLVTRIIDAFDRDVRPRLDAVPLGVIYADANDYNLLVENDDAGVQRLTGIIDFGDAHRTAIVGEVAIAAAYAMLGKADPLTVAQAIVSGYDHARPLQGDELALVFPLVLTRLAVSVVNSALAAQSRPDDPYVTISEAPAWALLERIGTAAPEYVEARLRAACGRDPWPAATRVMAWLRAQKPRILPPLGPGIRVDDVPILDLSFESVTGGDDPQHFDIAVCSERIDGELTRARRAVGIGRYGEPRPIYTQPAFGVGDNPIAPRRTRHLGIDLFAAGGTPVHLPLAGHVVATRCLPDPLDYGGLVIVRHATDAGDVFETVWGHLAHAEVQALAVGQPLAAGQLFARLGTVHENGGWPPHVHVQLVLSAGRKPDEVPDGVADPDDFIARAAFSPCPAVLLDLADDVVTWREPDVQQAVDHRAARIAHNVKTSYDEPVRPVRAFRHLMYDAHGRPYIDAYNNVPHVGHAHPHVVEAATRQMRLISTNTRYLHENLLAYADAMVRRLPAPLSVCFFVNSGSEANELALRLARAHTGARDMLVMAHAYHGNTTGAIDISPYKFDHPRGSGRPPWVHVTMQPDVYRGPFHADDSAAGAKYAAGVAHVADDLTARGVRIAGYISECVPSVGGQIVLPPGFLAGVYARVRAAGGVCIADDVQTALGRMGAHFWGFEMQGVVPDILVLGKPLGNGHPLGAVVTTPEIAASFAKGPEFFSTFGGSTVSCAVGLAVLEVIEREGLQAHARQVGAYLLNSLHALAERHAIIGDVRGSGLFLGVELVTDRETKVAATRQARYIVNRMRAKRILIGTEGPSDCVLKIRPPMTFDRSAADVLLATLDEVLDEDAAQPAAR